MGPQVALLVAALAGCLLRARSCVICDPRVVAALDALEKEYLPTHLAPDRHRQVMERIRETVRDFGDLPYLEDTFMGVIDEATMETSVLSFLRSVTLIRNSGAADGSFEKEVSKILTREKATFQSHILRFQREDLCPNKCGTMLQRLMWCSNCVQDNYICRKSRDCGVRHINVHEKEDLVLDCELHWHKLSQGLTYYSFYRVWGSNSETLLYKGKRPTLTKPLVGPEDAGNYRCELGIERSGPATVIHFQVTVLPQRIFGGITSESSTFVTQPSTTETQSPTVRTQSPAIGSEAEEIWGDLSPTLRPSECSNPKNVQTGLLIGLLLWSFLLLILGFVTGRLSSGVFLSPSQCCEPGQRQSLNVNSGSRNQPGRTETGRRGAVGT
ncbi:izumo sperm-egg fusion protein 1-like isoform X1 [Felis catus]|uniref:izumo sperm-egg fusion protein 1-like isoform X1 n=1 Tax=Felis catus TaxID=9685 RepID=UPI001D19EC78|nr:izumo sperm-egg fusion protein 1-like isoform X1 [Felis catus]